MNNDMLTASHERFRKFKARPDMMRISEKYDAWAETASGIITLACLSGLALAYVSRKINRLQYRGLIAKHAKSVGLPRDDVQIMARGQLEFYLCAMIGTGQMPRAPNNQPK